MFINKRSIVVAILLSIFTCGLYSLYWLACIANETNALEESHVGPTGGTVVLLSIVTCGIYGIYFVYTISKRIFYLFEDYGVRTSDNSLINVILEIFGLAIVAYAIIQNDMNNLIDIKSEQK